jgi:DNA polymerase-3 subunit beta
MKAKCLQEHLARGLGIVSRAVATQSALDILRYILVTAEGGRVRLTANNLEMCVSHWLQAKVDEEGGVAVPGRTIAGLTDSFSPETVMLEVEDGRATLNLVCGRTEANVKGQPTTEFSLLGQETGGKSMGTLPQASLKDAVEAVAYAASSDESRLALTGVLMEASGTTLTLAAADGFRLAVHCLDLDQPVRGLSVIVPARSLREVARLCKQADEEVKILLDQKGGLITFDMGDTLVTCQLVDGTYPDYRQLVASAQVEDSSKVIVSTADFRRACQTARVFARDASQVVRLDFRGEDGSGQVTVQGISAESGDNVNAVDASIEGSPATIALDVRYLIDVLKAARQPQVRLEVTAPTAPVVLTPIDAEGCVWVIMPMQVEVTSGGEDTNSVSDTQ